MSRLYTPYNKIKFTSISESYKINTIYRSKLNPLYSSFITYVVHTFDGTESFKRKATKIIIPSQIQDIAGLAMGVKEVIKDADK